MKIVWISRFVFDENLNNVLFSATWLETLKTLTAQKNEHQLHVISFSDKIKSTVCKVLGNISYYQINDSSNDFIKINKELELSLTQIIDDIKPDIIHCWGTEFPSCLSLLDACEQLNILNRVVISIQGLCSIIEKHYFANLPNRVINAYTFRDFVKQDNIKLQARKFYLRGQNEIAAIKKSKHVIGRTTWDKAVTSQINPAAQYHFCNEILREEFYTQAWNISCCERNTIFLSQNYYPIKGFHNMLEAMPSILTRYPNAHIYTTGHNVMDITSLSKRLRESAYQKYLRLLIIKYRLENHITFLGHLSEKEMCKRYLKSHVFVSASSIENSPNSLGEAMILGVPIVASCVGGVQDMLRDKVEGFLYPYDEPYMLAHFVCEIFENEDLASCYSRNAKKHADETHNKEKNLNDLLSIYTKINGDVS